MPALWSLRGEADVARIDHFVAFDPQRKWKFAYGARSFVATIVPSGGSVPRVREHVVGSDLLLAYPLCAASKHSLPWGACGGRKGEAVQAATVGTTR
jgi:hypothetical protein